MFIIKQNSSAGRGRLRQRKQGTLRRGRSGNREDINTRKSEGGGYDEKSMNDYQSTRILKGFQQPAGEVWKVYS